MHELTDDVEERNYAKTPLTKSEIERIVKAVGSVGAVLNTRHAIAKEQGWKNNPPSRATFAAAAAEENNLLRRPIIVRGSAGIVSRDAQEIRAFLAS